MNTSGILLKILQSRKINLYKNFLFCDIHEGEYLRHPILWISDTNSALLCAQFEKSKTKRTTFLWKKSSAVHESPFNFKNWSGKSDEFEKLVGEVTKFLEVTKFFPDFFFPDKVVQTEKRNRKMFGKVDLILLYMKIF